MSTHRRNNDFAEHLDEVYCTVQPGECRHCLHLLEECRCDRWGVDTGRAVLDAFYGNGDRADDIEAGIIRPLRSDGSRFYDDWEGDANDSETGEA